MIRLGVTKVSKLERTILGLLGDGGLDGVFCNIKENVKPFYQLSY